MEISIKYQLVTTLYSIAIGVVIGMIYDIFKIFRILSGLEFSNKLQNKIEALRLPIIKGLKVNKGRFSSIKRKILYFIWDLLFFIVITPIMLIFIYAASSGVVRWYIILGAFSGYIIYYYTLSKIISMLYEYILLIVKIIFEYIMYFLKLPLKKLKDNLKKRFINTKKKKRNEKTENKRKVVFSTGKVQ